MANWIQVPGQTVVNFDTVSSVNVDGNALVLTMSNGGSQRLGYATQALAGQAFVAVRLALLNTASGTPTITTFNGSPVTNGSGEQICSVIGTNFQSSAQIDFGGTNEITVFISQTLLYVFYTDGTKAAGTYDVNYTDAIGGTATLVNGVTVV